MAKKKSTRKPADASKPPSKPPSKRKAKKSTGKPKATGKRATTATATPRTKSANGKANTGGEIDLVLAQREEQAVELRLAGASYRAIAARLGVSLVTAHRTVKRVLDRTEAEANEMAGQLRSIQLERIERMILAAWPLALGRPAATTAAGEQIPATPPDLEAQRLIAGVHIPQIAKITGLYSPERVNISGDSDPFYHLLKDWPDEALQEFQALADKQGERATDERKGGGNESAIPRRSGRSFKPADYGTEGGDR